jgi:cytochrome P450
MAGHETTATTLAWALHHLAANPSAQQRLFEELSGSFPEGVVDPDRARKLPYLTAVVNETLRLTPIAVAVPRRLREAVTLAGHHLPAGTTVGASIYVAHRSLAWERPDEFEPERFLTGSPRRSSSSRSAAAPVGASVPSSRAISWPSSSAS